MLSIQSLLNKYEKKHALNKIYRDFENVKLYKPIAVPSTLLSSSYSIFIDIANRFIWPNSILSHWLVVKGQLPWVESVLHFLDDYFISNEA